MKVRDCRNCVHFCEARWSHRFVPASGRAIGMTHVYGYCNRYEKPCREVKNCEKDALTACDILSFLNRCYDDSSPEKMARLIQLQDYAIAHIGEKIAELKEKGIPITKHNVEKAALELQEEFYSKEEKNNGKF